MTRFDRDEDNGTVKSTLKEFTVSIVWNSWHREVAYGEQYGPVETCGSPTGPTVAKHRNVMIRRLIRPYYRELIAERV